LPVQRPGFWIKKEFDTSRF